jgi:hypothetical protein
MEKSHVLHSFALLILIMSSVLCFILSFVQKCEICSLLPVNIRGELFKRLIS